MTTMDKKAFLALLKRKFTSLVIIVAAAFAIAAVMVLAYKAVMALLPPQSTQAWRDLLESIAEDPSLIQEMLRAKGAEAPWFFVAGQVLQVLLAPIPGQAVALAGGYVFGFWKGWGLTTLGLALGSLAAIGLSRLLGKKFVRRFVPAAMMARFDSLITDGGYTTFFMIFLLPALPDDAVCFLAGLSKLKLWPLMAVCVLGRAPGMAVLSLVGAQLTTGLTPSIKALFALMMALSIPLWLFWEVLEEKIQTLCLKNK